MKKKLSHFFVLFALILFVRCEDEPASGTIAPGQTLTLSQWTYLNIDDQRQKWGDFDSPDWLRYFGLDFADVTQDGYKDIVSGRYFYRNPGGSMSDAWTRVDLGMNVDGMLFVDVDGDNYGDIIGTALPDVYWLEAEDKQGNTWHAVKIAELQETGHVNGQGYRVAQIVEGGKPEILLSVGDGIYYLEIPDNPSAGNWPKTLIAPEAYDEGIGIGDIDGDGDIDIAAGIETEGGELMPGTSDIRKHNSIIAWWENPGDQSSPWTRHNVSIATMADRFEIGDLNGDGRPDIIVSEERYPGEEPNANLLWYEAPEDPTRDEWTEHIIVTTYSLNNLDVADLDNDGDLDIITNEHKGPVLQTLIFENDGRGQFTQHVIGRGREAHLGARAVDLDNDGDVDIVSHAWDKWSDLHLWRNDAIME